jgi:hypothetical protein
LKGKSIREIAEIVKRHIANEEYTPKQLQLIGQRFIDEVDIIKAMLDGLKAAIDMGTKFGEWQYKGYEKTAEIVKIITENPNSSEELKRDALKMMVKCYRSMLATQLAIVVFIVSGILALAGMIMLKRNSNHVPDGRTQTNKPTK